MTAFVEQLRLIRHGARLIAGRWFWLLPVAAVLWLPLLVGWIAMQQQPIDFRPESAQNTLIGFPLMILGMALGGRVIAAEIDGRTLEVAYTVPGGASRIWISKLLAAGVLLFATELVLAAASYLFFTSFPWVALYGALQAGLFYLVLSMAWSTLFRSEAAGAIATVACLVLNLPVQGSNGGGSRFSPAFNAENLSQIDPQRLLAWAVQNRIGFAMAILTIAWLTFRRADRREKMLAG